MKTLVKKTALLGALAMTAALALLGPAATPAAASSTVADDVWNYAYWTPAGTRNLVKIHRYLVNGHHYVTGYLVATSGTSALYYDRSYDGGATWDSFVDRVYFSGARPLPEKYDDGGVWYRVCGASEWLGNPYGDPRWGYNIACTSWY
ncbi:hypothetical protein ABTX77_00625 [Streptomyces sp. NPDC097704]|uniref:hypothetical protein n=1 Tax=Streptomyces sp. NPDC097704 TaxID=3157101 RepID=UPI00331B32B8